MATALFVLYFKFDDWVESKAVMNVCLAKLLLYTGAAIQGKYTVPYNQGHSFWFQLRNLFECYRLISDVTGWFQM